MTESTTASWFDWLVDPVPEDGSTLKVASDTEMDDPNCGADPKFDPNPEIASKLLCFDEEDECEDHLDCEFSPLDDPESCTLTAGLLLTVPVKLVIGAEPERGLDIPLNPLEETWVVRDIPLIAASIAASIWGPRDLITASTIEFAICMDFVV